MHIEYIMMFTGVPLELMLLIDYIACNSMYLYMNDLSS